MVSEEQIYIWTKRLFQEAGWTPIAGDPPRGTDLPRMEIKEPNRTHSLRKNANSLINDLVFCNESAVVLTECKDSMDKVDGDIRKLRTIVNSSSWRVSLAEAMDERSYFKRYPEELDRNIIINGSALIPCLAFPGAPIPELTDFVQITFDRDGNNEVSIGDELDGANLFYCT